MRAQVLMISTVCALFASQAMAQMTPVGKWHTVDDETGKPIAEIHIASTPEGQLTGKIVKSLRPEGEQSEPLCTQCTDDRRGKPKLGMEIIRGVVLNPNTQQWEGGTILDPNKGKTYRLRLTPVKDGQYLQVRGYIGPFFRTQIWTRIN